jgi:CheY-like chemotaxis protein
VAAPPLRRKIRILVVDDEPEIRSVLELLLHDEGWSVGQAVSGADALARCRGERWDLVILDNMMPGLTGMDVARRLVAEQCNASLVIFSAFIDSQLAAECRALGVTPVDKLDWVDLIRTCRQFARKPAPQAGSKRPLEVAPA